MTREEAKDFLTKISYALGNMSIEYLTEKDGEKMREAIKALEQEPCIQEKQANADKIDAVYIDGFKAGYSQARFDLEQLPSVTPQQEMGHWIAEIDDYGEVMRWHCDTCYEDSGFTSTCKWDFCPNCGAKMQEVKENA